MTVVVGAPHDFTLEAFRRVTVDGEGVVIGAAAVRVMGATRAGFERLLAADSVLAILALVSSQALAVTSRHPAPPLAGLLNGIRSVFPPVQTERQGQGTQAAELTAIFSRAALTGQLDFPSHQDQASP